MTTKKKRGNPRRTNGYRRDQLRRRVLAEEDTCWLCGEPVDKTLKTPDPWSPEIDEIIPVSQGGSPYDRRNCRLAHRRCNRLRSNNQPRRTPPPPTPLTTSRAW